MHINNQLRPALILLLNSTENSFSEDHIIFKKYIFRGIFEKNCRIFYGHKYVLLISNEKHICTGR